MTPSTQTLTQRVLDFQLIEIDYVTSAADEETYDVLSGDLSSTKSMFDVAAPRCSSYGTKNGLDRVLDSAPKTTLTDVLNSRTAAPLHNGVLQNKTDDFITRNDGHPPTFSIIRSASDNDADDGSADDVFVDVVSGTSGDLSSIHRSLCRNAQGNYDLDDATPVEPFVQELVQWKKARIRPKKSQEGGSIQFTPSNNKRTIAPSISNGKKQKTSLVEKLRVEKLRAPTGGSAVFSGVSTCVIAPSIVEKCFDMVPEVPHTNTLSSTANKPSELRQFRNRLPVELCSDSLTTLYKDVKNVAISRLKVGTESLRMTNHGVNTPLRLTDASSTFSAFASTPNPVILSQLRTSQQLRPSPASSDQSLQVCVNGITDISKAIESPMISAGPHTESSQGNEAAWSNVVSFDDAVEVVDLELEESDVDEGEELLLADTDADLASAVQFVELRPDDVIGNNGTSVAVEESPAEQLTIACDTDVTHVSDEVCEGDGGQFIALGGPEGDDVGDGGSKREGCKLRDLDQGTKAAKGLTPSKDGREGILLGKNSAASKKRVRRKTVIKYHATALTLEMFTGKKLDDRLKGNYLHANRKEVSLLKWQKLLNGNNFNEREVGVVSMVKELQDGRLSPTRDTLLMEELQDGNSPVGKCKLLPLEHCKELASNSVTHLVKRGKHWFKKILPPPSKTLNELECTSQEGPASGRTDSLPPSRSVSQSSKPCPKIALEPLSSSGYIRYVTDPIMPSPDYSPTCTVDGPASRDDQGPSWTSLRGAADGSSPLSPSFIIHQDHPEVQFVAMEDVMEVVDDLDAVSLADDCDPLGEDAEDPFSGIRTVDAGRDSGDAVGSDGSLQEHRKLKFEPREDLSDSGLGNSVDSHSYSPGIMHIKSEYNEERARYVDTTASFDVNGNSNSNVSASLSNETDIPFGGAEILCLPPPSKKVELPPPPGVIVRQYNLTSDAIHFHQSKQMIMDPTMVHRIQHGGDSRLPGVCDAEDFILRNFSSNNYVFCEVDSNTSHLPQGLHRFSLQVKGNRVYRSSKPHLTFRIQDASCEDTPSGTSVEDASAGNGGTLSTDIALPKGSGGLTDDESTSSHPRLGISGSLIMRNPHADLKRYLLASDRLQKLFAGLQQIQKAEKAARLSAHSSSTSPPSSAHAEALQELYSKRVHMQVHFHRVLHHLKVTWFREKISEANCRAAANNSSTSQHAS